MLTVGIDLAAEPSKTGVALIDWRKERAFVELLKVNVTDDELVRHISEAEFSGIDCPSVGPMPSSASSRITATAYLFHQAALARTGVGTWRTDSPTSTFARVHR
jgi:hypothetical protein